MEQRYYEDLEKNLINLKSLMQTREEIIDEL